MRGYLSRWQRADARYSGYPPQPHDDGKQIPETIGERVQRDGTQCEPVEHFASRSHEMGPRVECSDNRTQSRARDFVVGWMCSCHRLARPKDCPGFCENLE